MTPQEEWRPVVGYEGYYEVSDQGRVRSVDRVITESRGRRCFKRGRMLSLVAERTTVPYLKAFLFREDRGKTIRVHVLVAAAFIGPRPPGTEVCHYDGDPQNNHPSNLRYDTRAGNDLDRVRHGRRSGPHPSGRTHCSRDHPLTDDNLTRDRRCRTCRRLRERARGPRVRKAPIASGLETSP